MLRLVRHPNFNKVRQASINNARKISAIATSSSLLTSLLSDRKWMLPDPSVPITTINTDVATFQIIRDDIAPNSLFISGNKRRKLDAIIPELECAGIKDIVTCGGLQSAHLLAVAAAAAERGIRAHLLVRGEQPPILTGNALFSSMFAHSIVHMKRSEYAQRNQMLSEYAESLREWNGAAHVAVIPEGASEPSALLGMLRLVDWFRQEIPAHHKVTLVIDSGTGTSAIGLALGCALAGLDDWKVVGVMLAGPLEYYHQQTRELVQIFCEKQGIIDYDSISDSIFGVLAWVPRAIPRKFGTVLPGEVNTCSSIAARHGILVDPIWTLAAWERAELEAESNNNKDHVVFMAHTGGALNLCGIAQRYPQEFH